MTFASVAFWRGFFSFKPCLLNFLIMPKGNNAFYAVRRGRAPGVYLTWDECQQQTKGFSGARYKKFSSQAEAEAFVKGEECESCTDLSETKTKGPTATSVPVSSTFSSGMLKQSTRTCANNEQLSASDVSQLQKITQKLITSVQTINRYTTDGRSFIQQLGSRMPSLQNNTKLVLKKFDNMLLEIQNHMQSLQHITSRGEVFCHELQSGKRLRSPADTDEGSKSNEGQESSAADSPKLKKMRLQGDSRCAVVYTDGCCHNNGRSNSCAGIGVYWGPGHPNNLGERLPGRPTNNRAEIHAARKAIEQAKADGFDEIVVHTDSQFLINCITKWIVKWKKNGWKLSNGNDVINRVDLEQLENSMKGITVKWKHVRGHAGIAGNEEADRLANEGARMPHSDN